MNYTPSDWHKRFQHQAEWTRDMRHYLYERLEVTSAHRILDVGCGTGVLESELALLSDAEVIGVDLNRSFLNIATQAAPLTKYTQGDGYFLPYLSGIFDLVMCHFLLLWIQQPLKILREMVRVTRPGGAILAIAEPDYGGRIDFPIELEQLGLWQQISLRVQGADPIMGRRLASIFSQVGLHEIETGVLGGQWSSASSTKDWPSEWKMLQADLDWLDQDQVDHQKLNSLAILGRQASELGERVLFIPTFYAFGRA